MKCCDNCKNARLACNKGYVGCIHCELLLQEGNVQESELLYDLQTETLNTGWVYLSKRPEDSSTSVGGLNIMTSGVPVFRKDFLCKYYEEYKGEA